MARTELDCLIVTRNYSIRYKPLLNLTYFLSLSLFLSIYLSVYLSIYLFISLSHTGWRSEGNIERTTERTGHWECERKRELKGNRKEGEDERKGEGMEVLYSYTTSNKFLTTR